MPIHIVSTGKQSNTGLSPFGAKLAANRGANTLLLLLILPLLLCLAPGCPVPEELISIPNVEGEAVEDAIALLEEEGFEDIEVLERDSEAPEGEVFNQMPAAGSWVSTTTTLTLYVSTGETPPDIDAWSWLYGEDEITELSDIIRTSDGGYIATGMTSNDDEAVGEDDPSRSVYLVKLDSDGEVLWSNTYAAADTQRGEAVRQTTDGGYIIAGYTDTATETSEALLIKVDSEGEETWMSTPEVENGGYVRAYDVLQTAGGDYLMAGTALSDPNEDIGFGARDMVLIRCNSIGVEQSTIWYGDEANDGAASLQPTLDGGYIVAGYTDSFEANVRDAFIVKTNGNGVAQWVELYGGFREDQALDILQTDDGGYLFVGHTASFDVPFRDMFVVKLSNDGFEQWSRIIDIALMEEAPVGSDEWAASVQKTDAGHYVIAGTTNAHGGPGSVSLVILDDTGDLVNHNTIGGQGLDEGLAVELAQDNGYVVAGFTDSFGNKLRSGLVLKTDEDGRAFNELGPENGDDEDKEAENDGDAT